MVTSISLSNLANPLATSTQLVHFKNNIQEENTTQNFAQSILTNSAGILLRLPQEVIAQALVLLQRYHISSAQPDNSSTISAFDCKTTSAAIVYLAAKLSFTPLSPRSVINVYAYLTSPASPSWIINPSVPQQEEPDPTSYYVSEGTYQREKIRLFAAETHVLAALGFDTHVVLPHTLALTYIQALGVKSSDFSTRLVERTIAHLNGGLLSPQLIYLTHQPNALAVAAIYLAAKEVGVKLVDANWWEVFDVEREDLGFLVLAFGSLEGFAEAQRRDVVESGKGVSMG